MEYDIDSDEWTTLLDGEPLGQSGMRDNACFLHQNRFFVVGGLTFNLVKTLIYNIETGVLSHGPDIPDGTRGTNPVVFEHMVLVFTQASQKVYT